MFNLTRLKDPEFFKNPFPILCFNDFLTDTENDEIYNSILKENSFDENKWSGRKQIRNGSKNYRRLLDQNKMIENLYLFFNDKEILKFFLNKFENSSNFYLDGNRILNNFKNDYKENFFQKLKNKIFQNHEFSYLEMDFSQASKGYFREPHHDKNTRIINFLIYFNDLKLEDGGALEIFEYKKKPEFFLSQPKNSDLIKVKTFVPKSKQLIVFLSNPISIHGVSKLCSSKKRVFSYGSYTSNKIVNWKLIA